MKAAIGQDSHRFVGEVLPEKPLVLGGVAFPGEPSLQADSDGDVVLHAVTRAVAGITTVDILSGRAGELVRQGVLDSRVYLREALSFLHGRVTHLSLSIECLRPRITPRIPEMRRALAELLCTAEGDIGITAHTGEGLTAVGRGEGVSVLAILTVEEE